MIWKPNATVAAIVEDDGKFLMVEEAAGPQESLVLNQPAGHLEQGESLIDACLRETLEETAWQIELDAFIGIYRWIAPNGTTYLRFAFSGRPLAHQPELSLDPDIHAVHWLSIETIKSAPLRSPLVQHCIDDYLMGKRYSLDIVQDIG